MKTILLILDGWGHGKDPNVSAIAQAKTPFIDSLYDHYPNAELITHGEAVGLPKGQMGNSEVGHLNIGAGRIVYQMLLRINQIIAQDQLGDNEILQKAMTYAKANHKSIHLMGLLSDGGVHSHINHLKGLCSVLHQHQLKNVFIHAFMDGRDTDPNGGLGYLQDLQHHLDQTTGQMATVIGRYYAMDRDKRWQRTKLAYDLLLKGAGTTSQNILESIQQSYDKGITDEFMEPIVCVDQSKQPIAKIQADDVVICFNYRTDRCRQITQVLTQANFEDWGMHTLPLHYVTMSRYDDNYQNVAVLFEKEKLKQTLGEVLAKAGKSQIRMAETEKYPHVTFFFSGGQETPFEGEKRMMMSSPKVATYDLQPEMSAPELTKAILPEMEAQSADFICLNFANPDMVGHTGVLEAAIKAVETVDQCTKQIVETALANDYALLILADHGNAELMKNEDGSPHTAHTTNLVPVFLVHQQEKLKEVTLKSGKLGDVAPTILTLMGLPIPPEMTGESLIRN